MMTTANVDETFDAATKCTTTLNNLVRFSPSTVDHISVCVSLTHQTDSHAYSQYLEITANDNSTEMVQVTPVRRTLASSP